MIDVAQAARLLGRHVVGSSEHGARLGAAREPLLAGGRLDLRDAEVEHLGDLVVVVRRADEEDVLRLQVAVDDARVVRALQGAADVPDDPRRLLQRERAEALDALVERLADEELHDHVGPPVVGHAVIEDLDRVLALDRRRGAGLGHEARARLLALDVLRIDELDRDASAQAAVAALPDRPHAAPADEAQDLVLAGDQTCDGREGITHTGEPLRSASAGLTLDESPPDG